MDQAYGSWIRSTHYTNASGVRTNCVDCHLPPKSHLVSFTLTKTATGLRELKKHLLERPYDGKSVRERTLASLPDAWCTGCHTELFSPEMDKSAHIAHAVVLFPEAGKERTCVSCHPWVGHDRGEDQPRRIDRPDQPDEAAQVEGAGEQ